MFSSLTREAWVDSLNNDLACCGAPATAGARKGTRKLGERRGTAKRRKRSTAGRNIGSQSRPYEP